MQLHDMCSTCLCLTGTGNFNSSAALLAAANGRPPHPEIPGSNLKPAPPSNNAVSVSPAGWGDPLQELPEQSKNRTGPGQDASARPPTPSGEWQMHTMHLH